MDHQLSFGVERDVLVEELEYYFEQTQASVLEGEEVERKPARDKANWMLRKLENYGWINIETDKSYVQRINFKEYAVKVIKTLLEIAEGKYFPYIWRFKKVERRKSMEDRVKEVKKHWNSISDSDWYMSLRTDEKILRLQENPALAFHPAVFELIKKYMGEVSRKYILLPSSGDNHAAFAFAIMGAKVTSADISERQLENAKMIADKMGLDIEFVCDNTMELEHIKDNTYDLVYTSNGTLSWIDDLTGMYKNINRVLKNQGYSFMYDVHPFNRPFSGEAGKEPKIIKSYYDVMPDIHWRVQDIVNANIMAGLSINELAELPAIDASFWFKYDELIKKSQDELVNMNDWNKNPMAALPAWMVLISKK